jgi:hypothetical protein
MDELVALMEWYWQGKIEVHEEEHVTVTVYPPQIPSVVRADNEPPESWYGHLFMLGTFVGNVASNVKMFADCGLRGIG